MTRIHAFLCVLLLLPTTFADFLGFQNAFGNLALAGFEERGYVEVADRNVRDAKSPAVKPEDLNAAASTSDRREDKTDGTSTAQAAAKPPEGAGFGEAEPSPDAKPLEKRQDDDALASSSSVSPDEAEADPSGKSASPGAAVVSDKEKEAVKREAPVTAGTELPRDVQVGTLAKPRRQLADALHEAIDGDAAVVVSREEKDAVKREVPMAVSAVVPRDGEVGFGSMFKPGIIDGMHQVASRDVNVGTDEEKDAVKSAVAAGTDLSGDREVGFGAMFKRDASDESREAIISRDDDAAVREDAAKREAPAAVGADGPRQGEAGVATKSRRDATQESVNRDAAAVASAKEEKDAEVPEGARASRSLPWKPEEDEELKRHLVNGDAIVATAPDKEKDVVKREVPMTTRPDRLTLRPRDERVVRNAFVEQYKHRLTDGFHEVVDRDTNSRPSTATPSLSKEHRCTKQEAAADDEEGAAEARRMAGADASGSTVRGPEEKVVEAGRGEESASESAKPPVAESAKPAVEETAAKPATEETGARVKREQQAETTSVAAAKDDDVEDEELLEEEEEPEPKRVASKKRNSSKRWGRWGKWSPCSVSCGVGRLTRWRHCVGEGCAQGEKEAQIKSCTQPAC